MTTADQSFEYGFEASLPFATNEEVSAVNAALSADAELRPEHVSRNIEVQDNLLKVLISLNSDNLQINNCVQFSGDFPGDRGQVAEVCCWNVSGIGCFSSGNNREVWIGESLVAGLSCSYIQK